MWAIIRANLLGTEIFSIEVGSQKQQPKVEESDSPDDPKEISGGSSMSGFDRRPVEDVVDTAGWLPQAIGFHA